MSEEHQQASSTNPWRGLIDHGRFDLTAEPGLPGFRASDRRMDKKNGHLEVALNYRRWKVGSAHAGCILCLESGLLLTDGTHFAHRDCAQALATLFLDPLETLAEPPAPRFPSEAEMVEQACAALEATGIGFLLEEACARFGIDASGLPGNPFFDEGV